MVWIEYQRVHENYREEWVRPEDIPRKDPIRSKKKEREHEITAGKPEEVGATWRRGTGRREWYERTSWRPRQLEGEILGPDPEKGVVLI